MGLNTTLAAAFPPAEGATAWWDFSTLYGIAGTFPPIFELFHTE